jgi:hypothetical protein
MDETSLLGDALKQQSLEKEKQLVKFNKTGVRRTGYGDIFG